MGGGWEHSCSEPCSLKRPSTSLAPHQAVSQNHAQKFPSSFSVLKLAAQTVLHPLWKVHLWVSESPSSHSSCLLQGLGCTVLSLHSVVQGNMCRVTLGHGAVQGGTVPMEWLLHTFFREARVPRSACPVPVQLQAYPTNLCLVRQVPTQLHQLSPYTLFSRLHGFYPTSFRPHG